MAAALRCLLAVYPRAPVCRRFATTSDVVSAINPAAWASLPSPSLLSAEHPHQVRNLLSGKWVDAADSRPIVDPLDGASVFMHVPVTGRDAELEPFIDNIKAVPRHGLHNPLRNVKRYRMLGEVSARAGAALDDPEVADYFATLIQRVMPKSKAQALGEVKVTQDFLSNFSSDNVRFLAKGFSVAGDHDGQTSHGMRWPYGGVAIVGPFNFPLEIPTLQLMGALYMGNRPTLKVSSNVSVVMEQMIRLLHYVGLPPEDVDMIHCSGHSMGELLERAQPKMTQFTGSSGTAELLTKTLEGRIRVEDAGFDWKVLGPDVPTTDGSVAYVAGVCDQDAYACSGQKCSAQSILIAHVNWLETDLLEMMKSRAAQRSLDDLTVGPVLSHTTENLLEHVTKLLKLPGSHLLFGGKELDPNTHNVPACYGAIEPTAVFVPLQSILSSADATRLCTKEIFGPMQVVTSFKDGELNDVLTLLASMDAKLTAAVVSSDPHFLHDVLSQTENGTTYAGLRARTTGAPQNHWFGPAGDPRAAGIGSPGAILSTWSCHREIIHDALLSENDQPPPIS